MGPVYGQSGSITGLRIACMGESGRIYHVFGWKSHKKRRVNNLTFGAEILAESDADDCGFDLKNSFESIFCGMSFRHELLVDSRALFEKIKKLHEPRAYLLRKVAARMMDGFESGDLNGVKWIQGINNLSNILTKPNTIVSIRLIQMLDGGIWDDHMDGPVHISSE